jgi:D-amino-acid oxidase
LPNTKLISLRSTGDAFAYESESVLKRTGELLPLLQEEPIDIVGAIARLRPSRGGGARIEKEINLRNEKLVIHNYGAGGTGFQVGIGMASEAAELAKGHLSELHAKSKL